jgi:DNA transformation protein
MEMAVNEIFLDYISGILSELDGFQARKMFGGAGLYVGRTIFGIIHESSLYLKTDSTIERDFIEKGMERFRPYPDRKMTMPYFEVPPDVLEDNDELLRWSRRSLEVSKRK